VRGRWLWPSWPVRGVRNSGIDDRESRWRTAVLPPRGLVRRRAWAVAGRGKEIIVNSPPSEVIVASIACACTCRMPHAARDAQYPLMVPELLATRGRGSSAREKAHIQGRGAGRPASRGCGRRALVSTCREFSVAASRRASLRIPAARVDRGRSRRGCSAQARSTPLSQYI